HKHSTAHYWNKPEAGTGWNQLERAKRQRELNCGFTLFGWDGDTLAWESSPAQDELREKTRKSAQLLAQYCARSCALVCRPLSQRPREMYAQGYPHLSAQEVAQLVKTAG
ncbi:hypothetical protein, partial [Pseudomonas sp. BRM28]|uniref:hypothetical protein n=1 Tax=Pseudomonas sp. BRM28 TaxID=2045201 RepID=UPI001304F76C